VDSWLVHGRAGYLPVEQSVWLSQNPPKSPTDSPNEPEKLKFILTIKNGLDTALSGKTINTRNEYYAAHKNNAPL